MWNTFFGDSAAWYTIPAIVGTTFFTLRIVLMLVGLGHGDLEISHDIDHPDSSHDFQIFSLQSIAAFAMGFGWGAFAAYRGTQWGIGGELASGGICGGIMVWALAVGLRAMADLTSSGNIEIARAVGREGDVYVTVPAGGTARGQVRLVIEERQRIYNAISGEDDLPRGTRVKVVKINDDNTVTVARA
jgi:hypothetical protein